MRIGQRLLAALLINFVAVAIAHAAEVSCEYDANEEWPWWGERTCQTREPALLGNDPLTTYPLCIDPLSDSDGDGWGFENGSSCRVKAVDSSYPACSDSSTDHDGDGWGWENGQSCLVSAKEKPGYPECRDIASDPDGDGWGFEDGASCLVGGGSEYPTCSDQLVDEDGDGWGYENERSCKHRPGKEEPEPEIVFQQGFDTAAAGPYTGTQLNKDWNTPIWHLGFDQGRVNIVPEAGRGNTLQVTYPANTYGAAGASAFLSDLEFSASLPKSYEALYVSYDIKFASGFDFVRGGKLPGLCGYDNTQSPGSGCNTGGGFPDGFDGWSARGMWREDGVMENYVYHSSQDNFYGDDEYWGESAIPGQWHSIQHHVVLNTPGKADGVLEAWFDGKKVLDERAFVYRKTGNIGINLFYFSTFYGGNDPSWAPGADQTVYFDNFRIGTTPLASTLEKAAALNDDSGGAESTSSNNSSGGGGAAGLSLALLILLRRFRITNR